MAVRRCASVSRIDCVLMTNFVRHTLADLPWMRNGVGVLRGFFFSCGGGEGSRRSRARAMVVDARLNTEIHAQTAFDWIRTRMCASKTNLSASYVGVQDRVSPSPATTSSPPPPPPQHAGPDVLPRGPWPISACVLQFRKPAVVGVSPSGGVGAPATSLPASTQHAEAAPTVPGRATLPEASTELSSS